jgi:uncharacterized protein YbjT (DUF2867 family)
MASLFLTGAGGLVGRAVLDAVDRSRHRVVRLQRASSAPRADARDDDIVMGDLLDPSSYAPSLAGIDTVVHLAAQTGRATRAEHWRVNAEGTTRLVEASARAGVKQFLFVSSIAVKFGNAPLYHYAEAKRVAESAVRSSGMPHTIVRPTIVLGPGSPIGARFRSLAALPVLPIFGEGAVRLQPIDVRDVARVISAIIDERRSADEVIEVGGPDTLTLEELLRRLHTLLRGTSVRAVHLPLRPLRAALGLAERISLTLAPVTAGQLAPFANDSVADSHPLVRRLAPDFRGIESMLTELAAHA